MTSRPDIAFYAPIKPPDHPIPSGDRLIARNLIRALTIGGHGVELASRFISYSKRSDPAILAERKAVALEEADALIRTYRSCGSKPGLWITYHPYCKAPDWIGPLVSRALDIPYVTIEAARTGQGGQQDEWAPWRAEAQAGIRQADMHLVFKPTDRAYLTELLGTDERLREIPTFMETEIGAVPPVTLPSGWNRNAPVLVTTGMMRKGKKDKNFYMLAEILAGMKEDIWNLVVVGGGPEEDRIKAAYSTIPQTRIHWTGQVEHSEVLGWMKAGDIFIWPGWKEPIGMVYLEAQLQGLPVIAHESMGVPLVVKHGATGLLAPEEDINAMRTNMRQLLADKTLRLEMGRTAQRRLLDNHSIAAAAARINTALSELVDA